MDWTVNARAEANHAPDARLGHPDRLTARTGQRVELSVEGSSDPDRGALSYQWIHYGEAGTLTLATGRTGAPLNIENATAVKAAFVAPKVTKPETMHIILAVTDTGSPPLTRYKRIIITVYP